MGKVPKYWKFDSRSLIRNREKLIQMLLWGEKESGGDSKKYRLSELNQCPSGWPIQKVLCGTYRNFFGVGTLDGSIVSAVLVERKQETNFLFHWIPNFWLTSCSRGFRVPRVLLVLWDQSPIMCCFSSEYARHDSCGTMSTMKHLGDSNKQD